jgi:dihydropyrimidinase
VILDLKKGVKVGPEILKGISDFTLYDGHVLKGWPIMTILKGNIIMEDSEIVGKT